MGLRTLASRSPQTIWPACGDRKLIGRPRMADSSQTPPRTTATAGRRRARAISLAREVLPQPGGPAKHRTSPPAGVTSLARSAGFVSTGGRRRMCSASRAISAGRSAGFVSTGGRGEASISTRACSYSVTLAGKTRITRRSAPAPESGAVRSSSFLNAILCITHALGFRQADHPSSPTGNAERSRPKMAGGFTRQNQGAEQETQPTRSGWAQPAGREESPSVASGQPPRMIQSVLRHRQQHSRRRSPADPDHPRRLKCSTVSSRTKCPRKYSGSGPIQAREVGSAGPDRYRAPWLRPGCG